MTKVSSLIGAAGLVVTITAAPRAQRIAGPDELLKDPTVKAALEASKAGEAQTIEDGIRFCEVPAPTFKETARGEKLRQAFQELGLRNVRTDRVGNVLGDRPGSTARPRVVVSAHLDTVFSEGTDVTVKRSGKILRGPGIGDDCRGLGVLVGVIRALRDGKVQTRGSITIAATVGEEGLGDLRGVRELFGVSRSGDGASGGGRPIDIDRFVAIDGTGLGITNVGVGSFRYRVTFIGPGGHSYASFGMASPIGALGRAIAKIGEIQTPNNPKTTFNVGRVGGGTSVNSIASEAWMEVDVRSSDPAQLATVDATVQKAIDAAVLEENHRWGTSRVITVTRSRVGERPAGKTPLDSPILRTAEAVHRALKLPFTLHESSTDANIPMSLGIPAITIGSGGRGEGAHSFAESFDTTDSWLGTERALLLTIALAQ